MVTSSQIILVELIRKAFADHVIDQFGAIMDEAYLLDDWITGEGFLVNGITLDGLIYDVEDQSRTLYKWDLLHNSTLQDVLDHLKKESFA